MARPRKYPVELQQRAVRVALESRRPISQIARDMSIHPEALRKWVRQAEADNGSRGDLMTTDELSQVRALKREIRELRRANEILKSASVFFAKELDPPRPR